MQTQEFNTARLAEALRARALPAAWHVPGVLEVVSHTGSTNADLLAYGKRMGVHAPRRCLLATLHQTHGRGRHGRVWSCPPGGALALSLGVRAASLSLDGVSLLCGLAVRDALKRHHASVVLKWPNDVLDQATQEKLCGILVESQMLADQSLWLVIGIGINLFLAPPNAARIGHLSDIAQFSADLVECFEQRYRVFTAQGFAPFVDEFNAVHCYHQAEVVFVQEEIVQSRGRFAGVSERGAALLDTEHGRQTMASGELRLRSAAMWAGRTPTGANS